MEILMFSGRKTKSLREPKGELRDEDEFPDFERGSDDFFAKSSDVVLVGVGGSLEESVCAESFAHA